MAIEWNKITTVWCVIAICLFVGIVSFIVAAVIIGPSIFCKRSHGATCVLCSDRGTFNESKKVCECDANYAGKACQSCAPGLTKRTAEDGRTFCSKECLQPLESGPDCLICGGDLRGIKVGNECQCLLGYDGNTCEICADGFKPFGDTCVPETSGDFV
jgi:hypothetical protein